MSKVANAFCQPSVLIETPGFYKMGLYYICKDVKTKLWQITFPSFNTRHCYISSESQREVYLCT